MRILQNERKPKLHRPSLHPTPTSYLGQSPSSWTETLFFIKVPSLKRKEKKKKKKTKKSGGPKTTSRALAMHVNVAGGRYQTRQGRLTSAAASSSSASPREGGLRKENNQDTRPTIATRSELAGRIPLRESPSDGAIIVRVPLELGTVFSTVVPLEDVGIYDASTRARGDFGELCFS